MSSIENYTLTEIRSALAGIDKAQFADKYAQLLALKQAKEAEEKALLSALTRLRGYPVDEEKNQQVYFADMFMPFVCGSGFIFLLFTVAAVFGFSSLRFNDVAITGGSAILYGAGLYLFVIVLVTPVLCVGAFIYKAIKKRL